MFMRIYLNLNNNSSVVAYEIGADYIDVQFKGYKVYRYSYASAGEDKVERMKELAVQGYGLGSFIQRNARYDYE